MLYFLLRILIQFNKFLKYGAPRLYCALYDRKQKWTFTRLIFSYIFGIGVAFLFWEMFVRNLGFSLDTTYILLIILIIVFGLVGLKDQSRYYLLMASNILGVGFVCTTALKCIGFLICMGLLGKSGRGFVRALCVAYILSGPVTNLAQNGQEIVRVFACTTMLTYNMTKTRFDLMTKPFQNALAAMKDEVPEVRKNFEHIEDVLQPIKDEIVGDYEKENQTRANPIVERYIRQNILPGLSMADPTNQIKHRAQAKEYEMKYSNKMRQRCKEQLERGENRCKQAFDKAYQSCMEKLPALIDTLLCWPMKIDYICNMKLLGWSETGGICDPSNALDPNLGENMLNLQETEFELFQNMTDVQFSYEVMKIEQPPQLMAAKQTADAVARDFKAKKKLFDYVMAIMREILSFIFIRIILASISYHKNYLKRIEFDNQYITPYFKKIDERRKAADQHSILPLKKFEQQSLVDIDEPAKKTKEESKAITFLLLKFILEILISFFFLLLDHMVVVLLKIIADKSEIAYYQEGKHVITFHIDGSGLLARLLRSTLQNFNMHESVSTFLSNDACLPKPSVLPRQYYLNLLGLYISTFVLTYYSSIFMRSRRSICSFFYYKREKQRILHLYNKMLKDRKSIFVTMYQSVMKSIEAHRMKMRFNLFMWLRLEYPRYFGWLRCFKCARQSCLICKEPEARNSQADGALKFVTCETAGCGFAYCEECWKDIGEICIACQEEPNVIKYCTSL